MTMFYICGQCSIFSIYVELTLIEFCSATKSKKKVFQIFLMIEISCTLDR